MPSWDPNHAEDESKHLLMAVIAFDNVLKSFKDMNERIEELEVRSGLRRTTYRIEMDFFDDTEH